MEFKLSHYIVPSVISMVLVSTYTNIDGYFIGNAAGDSGLAAINLVWPIVAFTTSVGTGIGMGGAILSNNAKGTGNFEKADEISKTTLFLLLIAGIAAGMLLLFTYKPLLHMMGAEGQVYKYSADYALVISLGTLFQIVGSGFLPILRNEGKTNASMMCCIVGLAVHFILDFALVDKYRLTGAAVSTVVSQLVIMVLCLFLIKNNKKADRRNIVPVIKASVSPLGINFVPSMVLLFTNLAAMKCRGAAAVSAYAVMSYAVYTFEYVFQGVCDGVQPIISYCSGAGKAAEEKKTVKAAVIILCCLSAAFVLLTVPMRRFMPALFAVSDETAEMIRNGFLIYALAYPFKAAVKFISSYFYSVKKFKKSNLLIYIDPLLITPVLLSVLAGKMGVNGIWAVLPASQIAVSVAAVMLLIKDRKTRQM